MCVCVSVGMSVKVYTITYNYNGYGCIIIYHHTDSFLSRPSIRCCKKIHLTKEYLVGFCLLLYPIDVEALRDQHLVLLCQLLYPTPYTVLLKTLQYNLYKRKVKKVKT